MRIISISLFITVLTTAGLPTAFAAELSAVASAKAEPPTATPVAKPKPGPVWGAADVQPTPEHPVYFRWSQGYFPGAQPPLEWWEGTPAQVDGEVTDKSGKVKKTKLRQFADQKSKNILWKAPAGGWGLSHPIVVGTKVFSVGVPDVITCNDLATGKQLWEANLGISNYMIPKLMQLTGADGAREAVLIGDTATKANPGSNSPYRNAAAQPDAMLRFHIFDLSDPKNPKPVANNNLIGFKEPPADLVVRTYLKEFDPYGFAGRYKGTAAYCAMMGGPVPVGNKLLIQTSAFLYCIGEK